MRPSSLIVLIALAVPAAAEEPDSLTRLTNFSRAFDTAAARRSAPNAPAAPTRIDLSAQWGDPANRDQGPIGSCTAFATVALYEAASRRGSIGPRLRLSEADLYMQALVETWPCWKIGALSCDWQAYGFSLAGMDQFLRDRGALAKDEYPKVLASFMVAKNADREEVARFRADPFKAARIETPAAWVRDLFVAFYSPHIMMPQTGARLEIAKSLARFRPVRRAWPAPAPWTLTAAQCLRQGAEQELFIDRELSAGRPVAVAMYLRGLEAWGHPIAVSKAPSGHAFIVRGVEQDRRGAKRYLTRNSWGGMNPEVSPEQLCRVTEAVSLLAPIDR